MIFQTLDVKNECVGICANHKLYFGELPTELDLTHTWSYSNVLRGRDIEYASIYTSGKSLVEVCPENLKPELEQINTKLKAFDKVFKTSKIDLNEACMFDLLPEKVLIDLCDVKDKISKYVFENYTRPPQYEFKRDMLELISDINSRELNLDIRNIQEILDKDQIQKYKALSQSHKHINYDIFKIETGRLATKKKSFPILNLPKKHRGIIKATNDFLIEIDINGAEIRTFLGMLGFSSKVDEDIYEWIRKNIFNSEVETRDEAKDIVITWLYDSKREIKPEYLQKLNSLFKKDEIRKKFWDGKKVKTIFGREIESDEHHSISYINQSTFIDLFHRSVIEANKLLQGRKSFVKFTIHDSCVIDFSKEDKELYKALIKVFSETQLGYMKPNIKIGFDYGNMKTHG